MNRWTLLLSFFVAATWSLLLLPWVAVGELTLTGAELSDVLTVLPAIAILMLLISLYGRLSRILRFLAALILGLGAYLAISTDFANTAASIALQESITGVAGEDSLGKSLETSVIFAASQLIAGLLCLALLGVPNSQKRHSESTEMDARGLWESQS